MQSSELSVRLHRGPAGLRALRDVWERLLPRLPRRRFFHEWGWYEAWLHELEPQPDKVLFLELVSADHCVAIVPLVACNLHRAGITLRVYALPEHDHMPLADILCDRQADGGAVMRAVIRGLAHAGLVWDLLRFNMVLEESLLATGIPAAGTPWKAELVKICRQLECDMSWEQFASRLSSNLRVNLNKTRNRLAREPGVRFSEAANELAIHAVFDAFLGVEASGWKGARETAIASRPELVNFYRRLIGHFAPEDRLRVNTLSIGDHVVAAQFCFLDADTLYMHKVGYDEAHGRLSPGIALVERAVRVGGEQRRYTVINVEGDPPWAAPWKPVGKEVRSHTVYGSTWRARAFRLLQVVRTRLSRKRENAT